MAVAFPTTPVRETFTVADGALPSGWSVSPITNGSTVAVVKTGAVSATSGAYNQGRYSTLFDKNQEVHCSIPATASGFDTLALWAGVVNPNNASTLHGYVCQFSKSTTTVNVIRYYNATASAALASVTLTPDANWKCGVRKYTSGADVVVETWVDKNDGNGYVLAFTYTDVGAVATYPLMQVSGYGGFSLFGSGTTSITRQLDNYGAGNYAQRRYVSLFDPDMDYKGSFT